jgi:KDO2-lipid IV(A) lauroyltransferase
MVTAHFGNWELGAAVITSMGYTLSAVVLPQRLEKLNRLFQQQRRRHGLRVIPLGRSAIGLVHCLRRAEAVALLADRDFTESGQPVPFFGKPARMPPGAAWLSARTGAPILPIFVPRLVDDSFLLRFHPPIWPDQAGSREVIQARIVNALEEEIGINPYQWFIFRDYWAEAEAVQEHPNQPPESRE